MPFQIVSDLHLEINRQYASYKIPACAKHLVLAGDIGRLADYDAYCNFLQKQTDQFELVFLVLGNHEFYNGSYAAGLESAARLEREPSLRGRLVLLHRRRYDIPGSLVTVLGCTLWSKVPSESRGIVQLKIKDFQRIDGWTVDDHNAAHDIELAWLLRGMQSIQSENRRSAQQRSVLVATHHAPLLRGTSSPQHALNAWRFAFGTDVLPQFSDGVKAWVFGHTHYTANFKEGPVRVVSNQRGYVLPWNDAKKTDDGFSVRKAIRIP